MNKQILFDEIVTHDRKASELEHPKTRTSTSIRWVGYFLGLSAVLLPIPFGSVHQGAYLPYTMALSLLAIFVAFKERSLVGALFQGGLGRASQIVALSLLATIVYALFQYVFLGMSRQAHPILTSASLGPDLTQFVNSWRDLVSFFAVFMLTRIYLAGAHKRQVFLTRMIMLSGFTVSLIALSHWFYDTGRLFWIFEPETVAAGNRARWPFVNPNHLGDFLLPIAFLTLGGVINLFQKIFAHEVARGRRRNRTLIALIGSEDFHIKVLKPCLLCVPLLAITLAILGSQSRGAWFGGSIGIAVFFLLTSFRSAHDEHTSEASNVIPLEQRAQRTKKRGRSEAAMRMDGSWAVLFVKNIRRFLKLLVVLLTIVVVVFFLNTQGRELIAGRLEYGLLHSLEDIRWTFYQNSWSMLRDNPIFGVGLSSWFSHFPGYASPELAGLNAVYLHSDPYQFLIEMGALGTLPFLLILVTLPVVAFRALVRAEKYESKVLLAALFCSILSFSFATLPEFPLRIPAIQFLFAVVIGFFLATAENADSTAILKK